MECVKLLILLKSNIMQIQDLLDNRVSQYEAIKHITQDCSDVSTRFRSCFIKYIYVNIYLILRVLDVYIGVLSSLGWTILLLLQLLKAKGNMKEKSRKHQLLKIRSLLQKLSLSFSWVNIAVLVWDQSSILSFDEWNASKFHINVGSHWPDSNISSLNSFTEFF